MDLQRPLPELNFRDVCRTVPETEDGARRALQDTTGNVQNSGLDKEALVSSSSKKASPLLPPLRKSIQQYRSHARSKPPRGSGALLRGRMCRGSRKVDGRKIFEKISSHDAEAFLQYRKEANEKKRRPVESTEKEGAVKDDATHWPDELEYCFLEAMAFWPPIGRRKIFRSEVKYWGPEGPPRFYHYCRTEKDESTRTEIREPVEKVIWQKVDGPKDKMGRNELVSDYIYWKTNEYRSRKQISSHIQVLKGKLSGNIDFRALTTEPDKLGLNQQPWERFYDDELSDNSFNGYPTESTLRVNSDDRVLVGHARRGIRPMQFRIWCSSERPEESKVQNMHTFTSLVAGRSAQRRSALLESVPHWDAYFPHLRNVHHSGGINCKIINFHTSLAITTDPSTRGNVIIQFELATSAGAFSDECWLCDTHIYKDGRTVWDKAKESVPVSQSATDAEIGLSPRSAAPFWAGLFSQFAHELDLKGGHSDIEEGIQRELDSIKIMQELFKPSLEGPQRIAIFLWQFKKTKGDSPGKTTWQYLIPPASSTLKTSLEFPSIPPLPHPSDSIDGILWNGQDVVSSNASLMPTTVPSQHLETGTEAHDCNAIHISPYTQLPLNINHAYNDLSTIPTPSRLIGMDRSRPTDASTLTSRSQIPDPSSIDDSYAAGLGWQRVTADSTQGLDQVDSFYNNDYFQHTSGVVQSNGLGEHHYTHNQGSGWGSNNLWVDDEGDRVFVPSNEFGVIWEERRD